MVLLFGDIPILIPAAVLDKSLETLDYRSPVPGGSDSGVLYLFNKNLF